MKVPRGIGIPMIKYKTLTSKISIDSVRTVRKQLSSFYNIVSKALGFQDIA